MGSDCRSTVEGTEVVHTRVCRGVRRYAVRTGSTPAKSPRTARCPLSAAVAGPAVGMRARALLLCLCSLPLGQAPVRKADKEALIQLYTLLGGEYWTQNSGWDPDGATDPCDMDTRWFSVGCIDPCDYYRDGPDCAFGRITALTLNDNNLTGSITNWTGIGDLHNLTYLDMSRNRISGSLPAEIGNIQNIEIIGLSFNQLQGQIPTTMGNINSNTDVTLTELTLQRNNFTGTLPTELARLTDLKMFQLGFNHVSGSISADWANMTDLQVLYLNSNNIEGTLPEDFGAITSLRYLNMSDNNISGTLPPSIGQMGDLNDITLHVNRISGSLPLEMGSISPLRHLRMQNNKLNGNLTKFTTLGSLRSLVTLDLYENEMVGDVPASLQNLTSLMYLYVDNQHLKPLRQKYCGERIPNNGKYNWRIVRDEYVEMTSMVCENMHDTNFAFNSLQVSGVYPD